MPGIELKRLLLFLLGVLLIGVPIVLIASYEAPAENSDATSQEELTPEELAADVLFSQLEAPISDWMESIPADASLLFSDLNTGLTITIDDQKAMTSASLYKLFIAYMIYDQIDQGLISFERIVPEVGRTVEQCLKDMITWSDNECGVGLGELVGWVNAQEFIQTAGFENTLLFNDSDDAAVSQLRTTVEDVGGLLWSLFNGEILSTENSVSFADLLAQQTINDRIPTEYIDQGFSFAHKTANLEDVYHDAGFMLTPSGGSYLYVIMTENWAPDDLVSAGFFFQSFFEDVIKVIAPNEAV